MLRRYPAVMVEVVIHDLAGAMLGSTELDHFLNMGDSVILADGSESYVLAELLEIDAAGASGSPGKAGHPAFAIC